MFGLLHLMPAMAGTDAERQFTARFLYFKGQLHLSKCDGSPPVRVKMLGGFWDIAKVVYPLRGSLLNSVALTVTGLEHVAASPGDSAPQDVNITRLISVGEKYDCNVSGKPWPLIGTQWISPVQSDSAVQAGPQRAQRGRFLFALDERGQLSGNDGCNAFQTNYVPLTNSQGFTLMGDTITTTAACSLERHSGIHLGQKSYRAEIIGRQLTLNPGNLTFIAKDE